MQLGFWQIMLLAVVQGVTEFLPVSSSGHLVVVAAMVGAGGTEQLEIADVNIVLHLGTLASILVFYAQRVLRLLGEDRRAIPLLVVGTVPAVLAGLPIKLFAEEILENVVLAGVMLVVTGLILIWSSRGGLGKRSFDSLSWREALWIGISQAAAILPGLSRSGTTIATGLRRGLAPKSAATFSFLLAIPALFGAGVLEAASMARETGQRTPIGWLACGALTSFAVGLVSLWWLQRWLERGRFQYYAGWCIPLGIGVLVWQLLARP